MGTSFVESLGRGFWVSDGLLETWLLALVREIDALPETPLWLLEAREYWYLQAVMGCSGCVSPGVDDFVTSEPRRKEIVQISRQALTRIQAGNTDLNLRIDHWGGYGLHDTTLNDFLSGLSEIAQTRVIKTGRQFIKLLQGIVTSGVSDDAATSWMYE